MRVKCIAVLFCLLPMFSAVAQDAAQVLQRRLATIKTYSANFEQKVLDPQQQVVQQGTGTLMLKQPAQFRFETVTPEPNLFIGDGKTLWFYNEVLEQLTLYDAESEVNRTPFALLTSNDASLWAQYSISQKGNTFDISAKDSDSPVKQLTLTFSEDVLSAMRVLDMNNQLSVFEFTLVQQNITLENGLFRFTAPEGTEIDDQRQN